MTWTKLSDDFSDDCWTLSDGAFRLHVEALNWSNRKLLDCKIPKSDVVRFARNGAADVLELVSVGWWTEAGSDYLIQHHATYQRSKDQVLSIQKRNVKNGQSGGRPPKPTREVWNPDNPDGLRDGLPDGNPKGQDRTGLAKDKGGVAKLNSGSEAMEGEACPSCHPWPCNCAQSRRRAS